jgi:serine/threonine protein kinase/Flp pilus assembly protein TadD
VNPDAWKRLEKVIDQALEMDTDERRVFLDGLDDPELRQEAYAFLAAEQEGRGLLETPVDEKAADLLQALSEDESSWDALQLEGESVGPYRALRELGRGGMGAVFLAERVDGQFEQRVALKLIKRGMAVDDVLERFRAERQILARLQHAHIARLLDGGVSASGQPYFAMELVEGAPLTVSCDSARLGIEARLRLFLQVCEAVEYAHRNLVVHRDLKPSNILVTAEGQAKLLDFGIAKVLEPAAGGGDSATLTRREARALTPQYAAPEQLVGEPVTTATDVYSLGVVLYELLSGHPPYRLHGLSPAEMERVVVEHDPESLSSAVRRVEGEPGPQTIAEARGVGVERLARVLHGDLDTIVRMALRKEPQRRYPSARALADDLQRFLDGLPVSARADTFAYRASKFARRHRLAVASAALVTLSVVAGIVGTLWQAREAVRQAKKAAEVQRFAFSLFEVSDPDVAKGKEITARQLLDRAAQRIQSELAGQPDVEAEMLLFVGNIDHRVGLERESRPLFERALKLRRDTLKSDELGVAEAEVALGGACLVDGDLEKAEALFTSGLERRRKRLGDEHPDTAVVRGLVGRTRLEKGDLSSAERLLSTAIESQRRHLPGVHPDLAANLNALGRVRQLQGDLDSAERHYREALAMHQRLFGDEHSAVSLGFGNLAAVMKDRGDVRGAQQQYRKLLANQRGLFGDTSEATAGALNNLGAALVVTADCTEAKSVLQESLDVHKRLYGADSPQLAVALHNLARAFRCLGAFAEAEPLSRQALERAVVMLGDDHPNVAATREELARIVAARGKLAEAEGLARRALATCRTALPDHPRLADALLTLGRVLVAAQRAGEAEALLREALAIFAKRFGDRDWRTIEARVELVECQAVLGHALEPAADMAAGYEALVATLGATHPLAARAKRAASLSAGHRSTSIDSHRPPLRASHRA